MVRTQKEFEEACDFIDTDMELYDFQLSDRMSSYEYNLYLQDTEYFLNFLYEKIRTLEDLSDYLDHYIDTKITAAQAQIDHDIQIVADLLESDNTFQAVTIIPVWDKIQSRSLKDRDGNYLPSAASGEQVTPAVVKSNHVRPRLFIKNGPNYARYDNLNSVLRDGYYLTCYQSRKYERPEENITIVLPAGADFNCIDIRPLNCSVTISEKDGNVSLLLKPNGYNKEYRAFAKNLYQDAALNKIAQRTKEYIPENSIAYNASSLQETRLNNEEDRYLAAIRRAQQTDEKNRSKAGAE